MTPFTRLASRRSLAALAALSLVAGFVDLWRGGITVAPILLVVAYLVLIPAALWRGGVGEHAGPGGKARPLDGGTRPSERRPSYGAAALSALAVFALYLATLAPTTAMWDTSEYITAAYTLGLPHPPGNPLFVLVGRVFSVLPIASSVAVRVNLLAALASAVSAGLWFLVAERVAAAWSAERWVRLVTGGLAALIGATAFTVWNQSVVNEKVYTVSLVGLAVVAWLAMRWTDEAWRPGADRLLVLIAYLCGLGYANHMAGLLPLPAVALAVLLRRPGTLLRPRLVAACAAALLLGVSPFATQPIRAAHNPPINEGEPTACREGIRWSCTMSAGTYRAFAYNLNREQYGKPSLGVRQAPFTAQVGMWWQYFRWQWLRDAHLERQGAQGALAGIFLLLGVAGAVVHFRRDRGSFWFFAPFVVTLTLVLVFYLNFKYGATQAPGLGDGVEREVRDRDYFFLWSFSAWGVWAALGLVAAWRAAAESLGSAAGGPHRRLALASPLLAVAFVPLAANWRAASRAGETVTADFARDLLNSVEPYGVLVTYGDNDTFPLWYAQEVEGVRRDVTVAVLSLLNTDWFVRGIVRRPVHEYDAARGPAIYRGRAWPKPADGPLDLTLAQADSLPEYVLVREPARFEKGELRATIDPRRLPPDGAGGGVLMRADIVVLRMIADSWPERPIYISRTTGNYSEQLGLSEHLLSQGLARKLVLPGAAAAAGAVYVEGSGWFDAERSKALWTDVFRGAAAVVKRGDWIDRPSVSIPFSYIIAGSELGEVLQARGDSSAAAKVLGTVREMARAVRVQ